MSTPKTTRLPFKIEIIDADCRVHTFGPIELDIPDVPGIGWEGVAEQETEAKAQIVADLQCSIDTDALIKGKV